MSARPGSHVPRLPPVSGDDLQPWVRELIDEALDVRGGPPAANLLGTIAHNPGLLRRWIPYGGRLLANGKLPARVRELAILRVAVRLRSDYEWSQHVPIASREGLDSTTIEAVRSDVAHLSPIDRLVIDGVDEMLAHGVLSGTTWQALAERFEPDQLVEFPLLVGAYVGLAFLLNSAGVALEPGFEGLPEDGAAGAVAAAGAERGEADRTAS